MLSALSRHGLVGSTIATALALAMLGGLGSWQMQRKAWKEGLLAQIAERTKAPPTSLADVLSASTASFEEPYDPEYVHVRVNGRFHYDKEQFLWAPDADLGPGYHVYTPLEFAPGQVAWVNRGYVPDALRAADQRHEGQPPGEVSVTGLVRKAPAAKAAFTPDNEASRHTHYWRSLEEMHAAAFGASPMGKAAYFIDADREPGNAGGWPKGGVTLIDLPNRHLEYAITWYGLAAALLAVYAAFVLARVRGPPP